MVLPDDTESTSASTISTLNGRYPQRFQEFQYAEHEEQLHPEQYEEEEPRQKYYKKNKMQRRSRPFLDPISAVRRISWDHCNLDRDGSNKTSNSRTDRRSGSTPNRVRRRRSGQSFSSLRGSTSSAGGSINPHESLNGRHNEDDKKSSRAVTIGRELFVVFILITASVFGSMSY